MIDRSQAIAAFVDGASHKFRIEDGAGVVVGDGGTAIIHQTDIEHPSPRAFGFRHELLVTGAAGEADLTAVRRRMGVPDDEHVVNLFSHTEADRDRLAVGHGYVVAWRNVVMARSLACPDPDPADMGYVVRGPVSATEVAATNDMGPDLPLGSASLADPDLVDLIALDRKQVVGKAQLVIGLGAAAYVSDMFTAEAHRRKGVGRAMATALQNAARTSGASATVLVPSRMAREFRFYERLGYETVAHFDVMIPAG